MRKTTKFAIASVAVVGVAASVTATSLLYIGNKVYNQVIKRRDFKIDNVSSEFRKSSRKWIDWWYKQPLELHEITSFDNLLLKGYLLKSKKRSNKVAIVVHGHECISGTLGNISHFYYETMGYNVFAPDLRGHGVSEGECYGMSVLDSEDIVSWMKYIVSKFGEQVEIVLHGNSMGAASCMIASAKPDAPINLKCLVEDCGFSDGNELFEPMIEKTYPKIPKSLILSSISSVMKFRGKYTLSDSSAIQSMKISNVPTLFIHGSDDALVPVSMVHDLYEAKIGEKQKLVVEGAVHGTAYYKDTKLYTDTVKQFILKHLS